MAINIALNLAIATLREHHKIAVCLVPIGEYRYVSLPGQW